MSLVAGGVDTFYRVIVVPAVAGQGSMTALLAAERRELPPSALLPHQRGTITLTDLGQVGPALGRKLTHAADTPLHLGKEPTMGIVAHRVRASLELLGAVGMECTAALVGAWVEGAARPLLGEAGPRGDFCRALQGLLAREAPFLRGDESPPARRCGRAVFRGEWVGRFGGGAAA